MFCLSFEGIMIMKIETNRLMLRPFNIKDIEPFAKICADPDVMRYIGSGPHDKQVTEQKIKNGLVIINEMSLDC